MASLLLPGDRKRGRSNSKSSKKAQQVAAEAAAAAAVSPSIARRARTPAKAAPRALTPAQREHITGVLDELDPCYRASKTEFNPLLQAIAIVTSGDRDQQIRHLNTVCDTIERDCLSSIVKASYSGFTESIASYNQVFVHVEKNKKRVKELAALSSKASSLLKDLPTSQQQQSSSSASTSASNVVIPSIHSSALGFASSTNVMTLAQMHQQTTAMLKLLEQVQWLRRVPERLGEHFKAKRMLHAGDVLSISQALLQDGGALAAIPAVAPLRRTIMAERAGFPERISEEFHKFLYGTARAAAKPAASGVESRSQSSFAWSGGGKGAKKKAKGTTSSTSSATHVHLSLAELLQPNRTAGPTIDDTETVQETIEEDDQDRGSRSGAWYMIVCLEAVAMNHQLDDVAGIIMSRLRIEIRAIISEAIAQAKEKYRSKYLAACLADASGSSVAAPAAPPPPKPSSSSRITVILGETVQHTSSPPSSSSAASASSSSSSSSLLTPLSQKLQDAGAIRKKALEFMLTLLCDRCYDMMQRHQFLSQAFRRASSKALRVDLVRGSGSLRRVHTFDKERAQWDSTLQSDAGISCVYDVDVVWEVLLAEIKQVLQAQLQSPSAGATSSKARKQLFRFADSSAATYQKETAIATAAVVNQSSGSTSSSSVVYSMLGDGDDSSLFRASPANVSVIYRCCKTFNQRIANLLGSSSPKVMGLHSFVCQYVSEVYMPSVQRQWESDLSAALERNSAWNPTSNSMYLQCIVEIADRARTLRDEIAPLDDYVPSVIMAVESAIQTSFLGACNRRLEQSLRGTLTEERLSNARSYELFASDPALRRLFSPQFVPDSQRFTEDSAFLEQVYKEEDDLLEQALTKKSLSESRIIVSPAFLLFLAAMHQSLQYLLDVIQTLSEDDSSDDVLCTKLYDLSVRCLVALKMELRSHVYCFLGRPEASDVSARQLNASFKAIEPALLRFLPPQITSYLFQGIGFLVSSLLILRLVSNEPGTAIKLEPAAQLPSLCRSIFHLQQDLIAIVFEPHSSIRNGACMILDKIRAASELLQLSKQEYLQFVRAEKHDGSTNRTLSVYFTRWEFVTMARHVCKGDVEFLQAIDLECE